MKEFNNSKELYKRLIIRFILATIYIMIIIFILPRVFRLFYPFIFALILAAILNPLVSKIHMMISKMKQKSIKTRKIITLLLNLIIILVVSTLIFYISYRLVKEIISFSLSIQQNWPNIVLKFDGFQDKFDWLVRLLPQQVIEFLDGFRDSVLEFTKNTSKKLLSSSISTTASIITGAGTFFINFLTFFLAVYFLISDYHLIGDMAKKYSSKGILKTYNILKTSVISALGGYFKAQLILALFAFIFMLVALSIYGQPHAFVIALLLGIIDFLPIIGTIGILIPWGIIEFIGGDMNKGLFVIIIGIIFFLIRRIIEPKVMGSQTGLHPLLALMSTYVGLRISGVWGAILGPLLLMLIIGIVKSGIFDNTKSDLKEVFAQISKILDRTRKE